jgi:hypothetical protein
MEQIDVSAVHWSAVSVEVDAVTLLFALLIAGESGDGREATLQLTLAGGMELRQRLTDVETGPRRFAGIEVADGRLGAAAEGGDLDLICSTQLQVGDE